MPWIVAAASCLAVLLLIAPLRRWLETRAVLDMPNQRSSHLKPVPRGAGLVVVPVIAIAWAVLEGVTSHANLVPLLALLLAAFTWLDDLRGLDVLPRLVVQLVAVSAALVGLPKEALVFQGWLPLILDRAAAGLLWLWFINLYNFMDGIDGLTGLATVTIAGGAALMPWIAGDTAGLMPGALVIAAAALGFLAWNRPPARIFLGDVGSIGLGFLVGWVLLQLALRGYWAAALLLPLYHLGDATLTLGLRIARGDRVWLASRAHFYQRGAAAHGRHAPVLLLILAVKLALVALALLSAARPDLAPPTLLAGGLIVLAALWYLAIAARRVADAAR